MVPTLNETKLLYGNYVSMIYATPSPFWLTIAHELIHLKHWLDTKCSRTSLTLDDAISRDNIKLLSYDEAQKTDPNLIIQKFSQCPNPYGLLALLDDLNSDLKNSKKDESIKKLKKFFLPFAKNKGQIEKIEVLEDILPEFKELLSE